MKAIPRADYTQAMVDSLGSGFGIFVELIADIIQQSGFIHLLQDRCGMLEVPAREVQQIISIAAQGAGG